MSNVEERLPTRKRNRAQLYDYSSCGAYFITICTMNKECLFWAKGQPNFVGEDIILPPESVRLSAFGQIVDQAIQSIPKYYPNIEVWDYVIMPNHVHMILVIPEACGRIISSPTNKGSVLTAVGQMKRHVSKKVGFPIWQRSFHDHIIRNRKDYEQIAKYIYENPIRWQFDCFYTADDEMR